MKVRIKFRKNGVMKFIGHLDVMRYFQKVMRRADIPIAFTGGFSPHMIMSFANPLGVGLTSDGEYFDIELTEPISSAEAIRRMNATMVEGMEVVSFVEIPDEKKSTGMAIVEAADYLSKPIKGVLPDNWEEMLDNFFAESEIINYIGEGQPRENIAAGVIDSVAVKVAQLYNRKTSRKKIILTGGLSHSAHFARTLEAKIGKPVGTMQLGRFAGALGAALLAEEKVVAEVGRGEA